MPKVRNITVAVSPELYRQTRRIAADSDTTITELVRHILVNLPVLLRSTNHPAADSSTAANPASPSAAPASFAIPASHSVASALQPAATGFQSARSSAQHEAYLARKHSAVLRQMKRLLNN